MRYRSDLQHPGATGDAGTVLNNCAGRRKAGLKTLKANIRASLTPRHLKASFPGTDFN